MAAARASATVNVVWLPAAGMGGAAAGMGAAATLGAPGAPGIASAAAVVPGSDRTP